MLEAHDEDKAIIEVHRSLKLHMPHNIFIQALDELDDEIQSVTHGSVGLTITIHDGKFQRYTISKEKSVVPGRDTSGAQ
jgi:hypothetical protein